MEKIVQFLKEVRQELYKVSWPSFNEFIGSTVVVLILVALFAVYLGLVDTGVGKVAEMFVFRR
jgi:preprotein translocase subunit SecE